MKKREVIKRFDLNEYEAALLRLKSAQCGLKEGPYIRELITGHAPKEAPGKEFYQAMNDINKIGTNINQIAAVANSTGVIDDEWLRQLASELNKKLLEIKRIVLDAEPYQASYYEMFMYEQRKAKEYGLTVPQKGDDIFEAKKIREEYEKRLMLEGIDVNSDY